MPEEHRGRLDRAIDRVVREMVQLDPRPGLRHRVAERAAQSVRTTSVFSRPFVPITAAAALVLLVTAFALLRSPVSMPDVQVPDSTPMARQTPAADATPVVESVRAPEPPRSGSGASARRAGRDAAAIPPAQPGIFGERTDRLRAANIAAESPAPEPTDVEVAPVAPALPLLEGGLTPLQPITIEPIRVAPLTIRPLNALPGGR